MKAEIIAVGTELLLGDIVNTNAAFLAKELAMLGIDCYHQTVVGDNQSRLKEAIALAFSRSDIVITSGGLGPTYDDLTKETMADYFGRDMVLHQPSYDMLVALFEKFNRPMTENNKKQAIMPVGAVIFDNDRGTANGLAIEEGGKVGIMLPGPPRELTAMFEGGVKPYLAGRFHHVLASSRIHLFGIGEAQLESELHDYMLGHSNPTVAPYAKEGELEIRVTARATTKAGAESQLLPVVRELTKMYSGYVYGVDVGSLEGALVRILTARGEVIATAESCTGGLVSQRITSVDGASAVFGYGVCSYANQAKIDLLGVSRETLEGFGAVSKETAAEMAVGVRRIAGADYGLAVTGIAGPTGGTKEKPVGTVYVAVSSNSGEEVVKLNLDRGYGGGRQHIRTLAASNLLYLAIKVVETTPQNF